MKTFTKVILIIILFTSLFSDEVAHLDAIIPDFQINDDQFNGMQREPSIAVDSSGNFIISWQDIRNGYIDIYDITGQLIQTLLNKSMPAGNHKIEFNAMNLPSAVYLYRIETGEFQDVKKMILLR